MGIVDKRDIESGGLVLLDYVGNEKDGKYENRYIQFLNIRVEEKENDCDVCDLRVCLISVRSVDDIWVCWVNILASVNKG